MQIKAPIKKKPPGQKAQNKKEKKLQILILEDTPADIELMERHLKKDGITFVSRQVESKSNYLKALKTFKPDIILADYSLPGFNALQALAMRNKITPATPLIMITGTIGEEVAVRCMKQGADDYLLKDRLARLGEAVKHALETRRLREEKTRMEATLQNNEQLYRSLIDSTTDLAFLKDDKFRHLLANQAICRFYGKAEKEILGKTDFELMRKNAAAKCRQSDTQALADKGIHVSKETVGGLTFETRKFPVRLADGRIGVGGYIRDISERKQAEDALRQSEERYRDLIENSQDLIFTHDLDGKMLSANKVAARLTGYPIHDLLRMNIADLLMPDVRHLFNAYLTEIRTTGRAAGRMRILTAGGEKRYWEYDNTLRTKDVTVPLVRGRVRDITEREQIEAELKESENRYRNHFENSSEFYFTLDLKGNFVDVNKAAVSLTGHAKSELLKMNFMDYTPKRDHRKLFLALAKVFKTGEPIQNFLIEAIIKDKSIKFFETNFSLLKDGEQIIGFQGSSKDITERKRAEEQIHASLREKEVLLKEIHHRVKNNLQVISGLLSLQAAQTNDEQLQRLVKESQARIWTMALIHQTLYQSGNLADIDMAEYIRSLVGNLLSTHVQAAMPPTIRFDLFPLRLGIDKAIPLGLITNELVTNVMKHAFADGRPGEIHITLQECRGTEIHAPSADMDATPVAGTACRVPSYELAITDNGVGLPAGFDLKSQKSLGLQLVAMLAQQLKCQLTIESSGGTAVHLLFTHNEKSKKHS